MTPLGALRAQCLCLERNVCAPNGPPEALPRALPTARVCNRTDYNGTDFLLAGCTSLDLSCPAGGACDNLLRYAEIAPLSRALGGEDASSLESITLRGSRLGAVGAAVLAPAIAGCGSLTTLSLGS